MRRIANILFGFSLLVVLASPAVASALPSASAVTGTRTVAAATLAQQCSHSFLGLKPWYAYLSKELDDGTRKDANGDTHKCDVRCFNFFDYSKPTPKPNDCGKAGSDVPLVLLAVVDDLLRISALVAIAFVLYGAVTYVGSQGNPDQTSRAQTTIINALLGLAIAIISVTAIAFIGKAIG